MVFFDAKPHLFSAAARGGARAVCHFPLSGGTSPANQGRVGSMNPAIELAVLDGVWALPDEPWTKVLEAVNN